MVLGEQLDEGVVKQVEVLTRGQRTNKEWFAWRRNRITASLAPSIARCRFVEGATLPYTYLAAIKGRPRPLHLGEQQLGVTSAPPVGWWRKSLTFATSAGLLLLTAHARCWFFTCTGEAPRCQSKAMKWGISKEGEAVLRYQVGLLSDPRLSSPEQGPGLPAGAEEPAPGPPGDGGGLWPVHPPPAALAGGLS